MLAAGRVPAKLVVLCSASSTTPVLLGAMEPTEQDRHEGQQPTCQDPESSS
jgi:hypothetical protein